MLCFLKLVVSIYVIKCLCVFAASLFVKGPTESVLEGDSVTLECLDTESELNMSSVHFEKLSRVRFNYTVVIIHSVLVMKCLHHSIVYFLMPTE